MLVLTRNIGQRVIITTAAGEKIKIELAKVQGKQAKLGFTAEKNITILREEIEGLPSPKREG